MMSTAEQHQRGRHVSAAMFDFADGRDYTVRMTYKCEAGRLIVCMPGQRVETTVEGGAHLYSTPLGLAPEAGNDT